jgi:hypothetical protein
MTIHGATNCGPGPHPTLLAFRVAALHCCIFLCRCQIEGEGGGGLPPSSGAYGSTPPDLAHYTVAEGPQAKGIPVRN